MSYVKKMGDFPFIVTAVMTQYLLAFLRPLSVALQSETCDLVYAYKECQSLLELLKKERSETTFSKLYGRATKILKDTFGGDEEPTCPRANAKKRQIHRANAPATTPEEFCRLNYYCSFLDHVISHLETRFPKELHNAMLGYYLLPCHLKQLTGELEGAILEAYKLDLPKPDEFGIEVCLIDQGTKRSRLLIIGTPLCCKDWNTNLCLLTGKEVETKVLYSRHYCHQPG